MAKEAIKACVIGLQVMWVYPITKNSNWIPVTHVIACWLHDKYYFYGTLVNKNTRKSRYILQYNIHPSHSLADILHWLLAYSIK